MSALNQNSKLPLNFDIAIQNLVKLGEKDRGKHEEKGSEEQVGRSLIMTIYLS